MANINEVALCPHCKIQLPSPKLGRCSACKRMIRQYESPWFKPVDTITAQYARGSAAMYGDPKKRDKNYFSAGVPDRSEYAAEMQTYYRKVSVDARIEILRDAYLVMQNLLSAEDHDPAALKSMVFTAKKIGELGIAVEQYLKGGGVLSTAKNPYEVFTLDTTSWEATAKG